ncbi:hypothetical protein I6G56_26170 [Burkholderia humptydooensis]|uniref:Uncharacterized protein n=1 Tax=Burkholderia humptydooensis TaxID=430531 RepID=A0A7T2U916_9BURK|nr:MULTISPECIES: hypothetical protein [Burkholderia]AJY39143.1 hypothetical protein BW21_4888 [Burkholderia sp. 2002721687]QPS47853.1 hypothetical protein I6G56_26170 [Burkholderia humptydooensis]
MSDFSRETLVTLLYKSLPVTEKQATVELQDKDQVVSVTTPSSSTAS